MPKYNDARRSSPVWTSQNFLTSSAVIGRIVGLSTINQRDHVVEIGAGKGHITASLLKRCGRVTAVEIDRSLCERLAEKFGGVPSLRLVPGDFLRWSLPKTPYKVFSNIPFNQTTAIIKKLTSDGNPPEEAWLVMEKGAAKRFMGKPDETLLSLSIRPFFDCGVKYHFRREDFHPSPSVDAVLFYLKRKPEPDLALCDRSAFLRFISVCFSQSKGVYALLTKKQVSTALKNAGLPADIPTSGDMLYVQWLCLFRCYLKYGKHA